jgi:hypothetical protein
MAILYIETNFVIGIAKGQDSDASNLLVNFPDHSRLAIPCVCYMEAFEVLLSEQRAFGELFGLRQIVNFLNDLGRDRASKDASTIVSHFVDARAAGQRRLDEAQRRLHDAMDELSRRAERL